MSGERHEEEQRIKHIPEEITQTMKVGDVPDGDSLVKGGEVVWHGKLAQ